MLFDLNTSENMVSLESFANSRAISIAILRIWLKSENISPIFKQGKAYLFKETDLNRVFAEKIASKLQSRANKRLSKIKNLPSELVIDKYNRKTCVKILENIMRDGLNIDAALYYLALNLFKEKWINEVDYSLLIIEFQQWRQSLPVHIVEKYNFINNIIVNKDDDILGFIYTAFLEAGYRNTNGIYLTPTRHFSFDDLNIKDSHKVIDPCCGSAQLLLKVSELTGSIENLYGFETDRILWRIARIRLLASVKGAQLVKVYNEDFLSEGYKRLKSMNLIQEFDFIVSNPPWGSHLERVSMESSNKIIGFDTTQESFVYFLLYYKKLLKENGSAFYILPEAILNGATYENIRNHIQNHYSIFKMEVMKNVFSGVISKVLFIKALHSSKHEPYDISRILKSDVEIQIIHQLESVPHFTLSGNADFALGIVTGDNKKYLLGEKQQHAEPIIRGSDVKKFQISSKSYIILNDSFQQVAPLWKYRHSPKLLYRFISDNLVFAVDYEGRLPLNSCNLVIPRIDLPIEALCILFNSSLYSMYFKSKFNSIKVLRSHIESLPIPYSIYKHLNDLLELYEKITQSDCYDLIEVDILVCKITGISLKDLESVKDVMGA